MAKIRITSTTNTIKVEFNDYSTIINAISGTWRKEKITIQHMMNHIEINIVGEPIWHLSHNENDMDCPTFQVDLIDGIAPTSVIDLYNILSNLIA